MTSAMAAGGRGVGWRTTRRDEDEFEGRGWRGSGAEHRDRFLLRVMCVYIIFYFNKFIFLDYLRIFRWIFGSGVIIFVLDELVLRLRPLFYYYYCY